VGGCLFAVVGDMPIMQATLTQRLSADAFRQETIFETCLPMLNNAPQPQKFEF
jgi:protein-L-isoaspartate(D-aspartate) O-methyltransferase